MFIKISVTLCLLLASVGHAAPVYFSGFSGHSKFILNADSIPATESEFASQLEARIQGDLSNLAEFNSKSWIYATWSWIAHDQDDLSHRLNETGDFHSFRQSLAEVSHVRLVMPNSGVLLSPNQSYFIATGIYLQLHHSASGGLAKEWDLVDDLEFITAPDGSARLRITPARLAELRDIQARYPLASARLILKGVHLERGLPWDKAVDFTDLKSALGFLNMEVSAGQKCSVLLRGTPTA